MLKRSLFLALAWMTVLGGVNSAQANHTTQIFTHASQAVAYTYSATVTDFNPSIGTLTSVVITVTSNITGQVQVLNIDSSAESVTNATSSVPIGLTGPNVALNVTATTSAESGSVGAATPPSYTLATLPSETVTATISTTLTSPSDLAAYIGSGTNGLTFTAGQGTFGGASPLGVFIGGSATADSTITVVYNFNLTAAAIPEPASMGLLGMGIAGFFAFRRFFDKRAAKV